MISSISAAATAKPWITIPDAVMTWFGVGRSTTSKMDFDSAASCAGAESVFGSAIETLSDYFDDLQNFKPAARPPTPAPSQTASSLLISIQSRRNVRKRTH